MERYPQQYPEDEVMSGPEVAIPRQKRYVSADWISNLKGIPMSATLRRIASPVITSFAWTLFLSFVHLFVWPFPQMSSAPHSLLGGTLALLLTFRTNSAYTRFWEGRTIWQGVVDRARDLSRNCALYSDVIGRDKFKRITDLLCAYPLLLQYHVEGRRAKSPLFFETMGQNEEHDDEDEGRTRKDETRDSDGAVDPWNDFEFLMPGGYRQVQNRPLFAANALAEEIKTIPDSEDGMFTNRERVMLLDLVAKLSSSIGACERLVQTPVPLSYARHTSRFLSLWCLTLPFVLVPISELVAVPVMAFVTWSLFGIQEIGNWIEEPFRGSLKLNVLCDTVYKDVRETARNFSARRKKDKTIKTKTSFS
jgi:predicted membrane chloride channel (bestrophin family)